MWKKAQETITITCEAPYVLDYCYLNPPTKTEVEIEPENFFNTKHLGICRFKVKPVSGIYTCGLNDRNGGEDIQTYYKVEAHDAPAKAVTSQVDAKYGKPLQLLVKSIFNHPISYCRFTNPNNKVHGVSDKFKMEGNYKFFGAGLSSGECGLQVQKVTDNDIGVWTCTFSVEDKEYSLQMVVSHSSFTALVFYSFTALVALTVILGLVFAFFSYRKEQRYRAMFIEAMKVSSLQLNN